MNNQYNVQAIYNLQISAITESQKKWKDILEMAGRLYRFEFDNIILIHAQRPHATLVGDYDSWKKVSRYVKRGSKGIAVFPSKAPLLYCNPGIHQPSDKIRERFRSKTALHFLLPL